MKNTANNPASLTGPEEKNLSDEIKMLISSLDSIKEKLQKKDVRNSIDLLICKLMDELQEKQESR